MTKLCNKLLLASALGFAASAHASPVVLSTATTGTTLAGGNNCYQMSVAYDPAQKKYYGGGGGSPSCAGNVWSDGGDLLQSRSPIGVDIRGVVYNSNTQQIDVLAYGSNYGYGEAGLYEMGRDANGLYTSANKKLLSSFAAQYDSQSVAAYDSTRNVFYSTAYNTGIVNIGKYADGSLAGTIHLSGYGLGSTTTYTIGYDSVNDVLLTFDYNKGDALVFDMSGAFIGASHVGGNFDRTFAMGYANGMLFLGQGMTGGYQGFKVLAEKTADVPEPGSFALVGLGIAGLAALRRRKSQKN